MKRADTVVEAWPVHPRPSAARKKRLVITGVKIVVSGSLIYWILQGSNVGEIFSAMRSANMPLLLLAFLMNFAVTYLRAYRWQVLLEAQGVHASMPFLFNSYLVSYFFSNFLPSTIGGDAIRMHDVYRVGNSKSGAVAVVLVDRLLGIFALVLLAVVVLPLSTKLIEDIPFLNLWILLGAATMLALVWIIFVPSRQKFARLARFGPALPRKLQSVLGRVTDAFLAFERRKGVLAWTLVLSLAMQAILVIQYYLIAKALGFPVPLHDFFLIVPLAYIMMLAPVSINAIGVRENVFVFLLASFGVATVEALAFSWLVYGMVVLIGLLGGAVYALRRQPSRDATEVFTSVQQESHGRMGGT